MVTLTAAAHRSRGNWSVDLAWTAPGVEEVDIHRNGEPVATVPNSGAYTDPLGRAQKGQTFEYQVCAAGADSCSKLVTVTIDPRPRDRTPV